MRNRSIRRRRETARVIRRRRNIVARVWQMETDVPDHLWLTQPHRLAKINLQCDCGMCKHRGSGRRFVKKDRHRNKRHLRAEIEAV